jgi:4-amino-4-deoxy-L-arabinose transferase-like glycosyltransferase
VRAIERPRFWLLAGLASGAAIMTKGAAGVVAPISLLLVVIMMPGQLKTFTSKYFWVGIGVMLVVFLPWHLLMNAWYANFYDEYVKYHVLMRTQEGIEGHAGTWIDYVKTVYHRAYPWPLLYPFATACLLVKSMRERQLIGVWLPVLLIGGLYGFVVHSKLSQYIVPVYPFLALACAVSLLDLYRVFNHKLWQGLVVLLSLGMLAVGAHETSKTYRSYGLEDPNSVKELRGIQLMGETIDSQYPLVVIAGVHWWPGAVFYSNNRTPINRPTVEELAALTNDSPEGVDVLLGNGEEFSQPEGTEIQEFGESEDYRYFRLIRR